MRIGAPYLYSFSRFGVRIVFAFCMLALAFRATLPFGDEPDFTVRAVELIENDFPAWTPYYWLSSRLQHLNVINNCAIVASPTGVMAHIDAVSCEEGVGQVLGRTLFMILLVSPVLLLVAWRGLGLRILTATVKGALDDLNRRIDALGLSLLLPGMVYYLGLLSHEQLTLLLSLFIFFFWGNWLIVVGLLGLIASLDLGNAVIVAAFLTINIGITWAIAILGIKRTSVLLGGFLVYVYFNGVDGLKYISYFPPLESKVKAILEDFSDTDYFDKYTLILRPVITFMTGIFMTPSGVKIFPLFVIYGIALLLMLNRLTFNDKHGKSPYIPALLSAVFTIMFFSFLLPNYANAKYYIFVTPFILHSALTVFTRRSIFVALFGTALTVPLGLLLFRI
jgi:hypothetical protein